MATEFNFRGESLTLATEEEFKSAVMHGKLVELKDDIARYRYKGHDYILSDRDLQEMKCTTS